MKKEPRKVRFFSEEEVNALVSFHSLPSVERRKALTDFAKKYKRTDAAVYRKYHLLTSEKAGHSVEKVKKTAKSLTTLTKNEFHIPIKNWEVRKTNDQNILVLMF